MDLAITRAKIKPNRPSGVLATRMVGLFVEVALPLTLKESTDAVEDARL